MGIVINWVYSNGQKLEIVLYSVCGTSITEWTSTGTVPLSLDDVSASELFSFNIGSGASFLILG